MNISVAHASRYAVLPIACLFGVFAGFSSFGVSRDFFNYSVFFESIRSYDDLPYFRFEPGFVFISTIFKLVFDSGLHMLWAFLATASLMIKFSLFATYKRPIITAIFYLCCFYPLHEYTQIRVAVALAFGLLATEHFFRGRLVLFGALIGAAFLFHASALIIAVAIPVAHMIAAYRLPVVIALAAVMAAVLPFLISPLLAIAEALNPIATHYVQNVEGFTVNLLSGANILTGVLLVTILLAGSLKDRRDKTLFILVMLALAFAVAFQAIPVFSHRLREVLLIFLVPLAFNMRFTPAGLSQFATAITLAAWYLYSHVSQGIIWTMT